MELPQRPLCLPAIALAPPQAVEDGDQIIDNGRSVSLWLANANGSHILTEHLTDKPHPAYLFSDRPGRRV